MLLPITHNYIITMVTRPLRFVLHLSTYRTTDISHLTSFAHPRKLIHKNCYLKQIFDKPQNIISSKISCSTVFHYYSCKILLKNVITLVIIIIITILNVITSNINVITTITVVITIVITNICNYSCRNLLLQLLLLKMYLRRKLY